MIGLPDVMQSLQALAGLGAIVSPVVVWLVATRMQARSLGVQVRNSQVQAEDSVSARLNALVDQLQAERDHAVQMLRGYLLELEQLRTARYGLEDMIQSLRDQALAARMMVHEQERRLGVPETLFAPLPYPGLGPRPPPPPA